MATFFLQNQSHPQANREYVFDDPLAPLRLPPLAQIGEFWRRYDRLADIHDKKLTTNLNGNLDVLLIFAALFSAINTTFISITMPNLSPNPSDETNNLLRLLVMRADNNTLAPSDLVAPFSPSSNSVIVNCLLYASLSCSLLAAVGAMMAKEWLQSFDRTGQTGPLEEQARFRQQKFNGVLEWHLEAVIKFLPNLLLLSVIFFFIGVCLFLFPINTVVAGIVIAFSGIGVVFSGIVIIAGAVSLTCPYQSAASSALRRGCRGLVQSWRLAKRTLIRPAASRTSEVVQRLWTNIRPRINSLVDRTNMVVSRVRLWAHRSSGLDESGGQPMNYDPAPSSPVLSVSRSNFNASIPPLPPAIPDHEQAGGQDISSATQTHSLVRWLPTGVSQAIGRLKRRWERLSRHNILSTSHQSPAAAPTKANSEQVLTTQAARWLLETTSNRGDQISTAQFICSLDRATCFRIFEDYDNWKRLLNLTLGTFEIWCSQPNEHNQEAAELFGLIVCRVLLECPKEGDKWEILAAESLQESNKFGNAFLRTLALASSKYWPGGPEDDQRILHTAFIYTVINGHSNEVDYRWVKSCPLLPGPSDAATALLGAWALLVRVRGFKTDGTPPGTLVHTVEELWGGQKEIAWNLGNALYWTPKLFKSVQDDSNLELSAAEGFSVCLQRARRLGPRDPDLHPLILSSLGDLIWSYLDHPATSGSTETRLVRLSEETLLTFKTFLSSQPGDPATHDTTSDTLITSAELIDTVVDILLDDFTSLKNGGEKWKSRGRTFKACVIRVFLWIWRNHPNRNPLYPEQYKELFRSSCRLWAPLEKEVAFSKSGSFNSEDKPLTPEDLKGVVEFAEWVQTESQREHRWYFWQVVTKWSFISCNADVEINRLYAHFERRPHWEYRLYDLHEDRISCSRSIYGEDGML